MDQREVITRRRLPHWFVPGAAHFVTFRLHGSIPHNVLLELCRQHEEREAARAPFPDATPSGRERSNKRLFQRIDEYLDRSLGCRWLEEPALAAMVRRSLYHYHEQRYRLIAYCIMPNHIHVLLQPLDEQPGGVDAANSPLSRILRSLKGYTGKEANRLLNRSGPYWQAESYDHWVRDEQGLGRIIDYIAMNPVKAGLVRQPHEWYWSSAHDRYLHDGSEAGWVAGSIDPDDF